MTCVYCGVKMTGKIKARPKGMPRKEWHTMNLAHTHRTMTLDHVIPSSRGGKGKRSTVKACYLCNHLKSNMTPDEWRVVRLMRGESPFFAFDKQIPSLILRMTWAYFIQFSIFTARFA